MKKAFFFLALSVLSVLAHAQDKGFVWSYEIPFGVEVANTSDDDEYLMRLPFAVGVGLTAGYQFNPHFSLSAGAQAYSMVDFFAQGRYAFRPEKKVSPFLQLRMGSEHRFDEDKASSLFGSFGTGCQFNKSGRFIHLHYNVSDLSCVVGIAYGRTF